MVTGLRHVSRYRINQMGAYSCCRSHGPDEVRIMVDMRRSRLVLLPETTVFSRLSSYKPVANMRLTWNTEVGCTFWMFSINVVFHIPSVDSSYFPCWEFELEVERSPPEATVVFGCSRARGEGYVDFWYQRFPCLWSVVCRPRCVLICAELALL